MRKFNIILPIIFSIYILCPFTYAELDMTIIESIEFPDSVQINSVNSAGDFNVDGYEDLLVGIRYLHQEYWNEAVLMYYGGTDFDTEVDLIFTSETAGYSEEVCPIGDFNGDGYDDFAVGDPIVSGEYFLEGRVYFFFGSPNPDTTIDLVLKGHRHYDNLGSSLVSGDFNGDNYDDLLVHSSNGPMGPQAQIYLGSLEPDTLRDILYDYPFLLGNLSCFLGGSDLNNDGYDEYGWRIYYNSGTKITLLFIGDENLHQAPDFQDENGDLLLFYGDINLDGFNDVLRRVPNQGSFLCLGSEPLDIDPDYYLWLSGDPYIINITGIGNSIVRHDWNIGNKFYFYNIGMPFDTIPIAVFDFEDLEIRPQPFGFFIDDIDADGNEDIAAACYNEPDEAWNIINIYSFIATDIEDHPEEKMPVDYQFFSSYPNPFNSSTLIQYSNLKGDAIEIYDITGRLVTTLACGGSKEGKVTWDATDAFGEKVSTGIYLAKAQTPQATVVSKLIFIQ